MREYFRGVESVTNVPCLRLFWAMSFPLSLLFEATLTNFFFTFIIVQVLGMMMVVGKGTIVKHNRTPEYILL